MSHVTFGTHGILGALWVTATNICFVYRTESLQQTDFLFVALSHCDNQNLYMFKKDARKGQNTELFGIFPPHFLALFVPFMHCFVNFVFFSYFWHVFLAIYNYFVCHSDLVRQTILKEISNFFVACDKGNKKTLKNKHPFKIEFHHCYQIALGYLYWEYMSLIYRYRKKESSCNPWSKFLTNKVLKTKVQRALCGSVCGILR